MTQQRDIERLLDHWFSDGPRRAPDRVVDIVADRIERQSQRPAWRLDWRHSHERHTKLAVAAAAVLTRGRRRLQPAARPSRRRRRPAPTASPTAAPTPTRSTPPVPHTVMRPCPTGAWNTAATRPTPSPRSPGTDGHLHRPRRLARHPRTGPSSGRTDTAPRGIEIGLMHAIRRLQRPVPLGYQGPARDRNQVTS